MTHSFREQLNSRTKDELIAAIIDIAERCLCDEDGNVCPEESVAGGSAADFAEAVTYTLSILGITEIPDEPKSESQS